MVVGNTPWHHCVTLVFGGHRLGKKLRGGDTWCLQLKAPCVAKPRIDHFIFCSLDDRSRNLPVRRVRSR